MARADDESAKSAAATSSVLTRAAADTPGKSSISAASASASAEIRKRAPGRTPAKSATTGTRKAVAATRNIEVGVFGRANAETSSQVAMPTFQLMNRMTGSFPGPHARLGWIIPWWLPAHHHE